MLPTSSEIAKNRLIHVLKLDRLEAELSEKKRKELTPSEFKRQLQQIRMRVIEDMYIYVFTCLPNRASKERLINELVEEYTLRLNHRHH